ncbi:MAG: glycosyltransferase [Eubacterium sp.]|nr:glycosyltransferase [Eubacterium sp.]MBR7060223.1 glycosyltransferase [Eubacterium sp.]
MKNTAAFIMPVKLSGSDMELRHFKEAVESIKNQTDKNWILIMVDDVSEDKKVYDTIDEIKTDLKDKIRVIYSDKNCGAGMARNKGIKLANELGAPFILFNDSDDISNPRRLELVRKAFEDESANVVYTSFDVIDENGKTVPEEKINMAVREIIDGHKIDIVEGENAFVNIASKKKYTNLTSCTAVRTSLAVAEPFPCESVSEDCNTWFRYGAYKGKFVFIREIKGGYRICTGVASRSRSKNVNFYEKLFEVDSSGFEAALKLAKKNGTMGAWEENDLRCAFYVRLALSLLHGNSEDYCKKSLEISKSISMQSTIKYIDMLYCEDEEKARMKEML